MKKKGKIKKEREEKRVEKENKEGLQEGSFIQMEIDLSSRLPS